MVNKIISLILSICLVCTTCHTAPASADFLAPPGVSDEIIKDIHPHITKTKNEPPEITLLDIIFGALIGAFAGFVLFVIINWHHKPASPIDLHIMEHSFRHDWEYQAESKGNHYAPVFGHFYAIVQPNGKITAPPDLIIKPPKSRSIDGLKTHFELKNLLSDVRYLPLTVNGYIDPNSIKVVTDPIDDDTESVPVPYTFKNGRRIQIRYNSWTKISYAMNFYTGTIDLLYTLQKLPPNEIRDFPPSFAMDMIWYIRDALSQNTELKNKFINLIDRSDLTLAGKLDAISQALFIPDAVKLQAIANVMNSYCFFSDNKTASMHNKTSWGSTWHNMLSAGQRIPSTTIDATRMFVILCQRAGIPAGMIHLHEINKKTGSIIIRKMYTVALVNINNAWRIIDVEVIINNPFHITALSPVYKTSFDEIHSLFPDDAVYTLRPNNNAIARSINIDAYYTAQMRSTKLYPERIRRFKERIDEYYQQGNLNKVIELYDTLLLQHTAYFDAVDFRDLIFTLSIQNKQDKIAQYAKLCLNLFPEQAIELLRGQFVRHMEANNFDTACELGDILMKNKAIDEELLEDIVEKAKKSQDYDRAIMAYRILLNDDPTRTLDWVYLTYCYINSKKVKEGIPYFEQYAVQYPDNLDIIKGLADLYRVNKDYAKAIESYKNCFNKSIYWEEDLTECFIQGGFIEDGIEYFKQHPQFGQQLAELHAAKNDLDTALEIYESVINDDKLYELQQSWEVLRECYKKADIDRGIRFLRTLREKHPKEDSVLERLGDLLSDKNDHEQAITTYISFLKLKFNRGLTWVFKRSETPTVLSKLRQVYIQAGMNSKAEIIEQFFMLQEIEPPKNIHIKHLLENLDNNNENEPSQPLSHQINQQELLISL